MSVILHKLKRNLQVVLTLIWCLSAMQVTGHESKAIIDRIFDLVEQPLTGDSYRLADGINIVADTSLANDNNARSFNDNSTWERMIRYARTRRIDVNLSKILPMERAMTNGRFSFGKNSFLTGFGLGFLAFGLKKLLLPIIIGAQIVKSILIAMFLPSILGSVGKLVGKGVTTFAQSSGSSNNFGGAGVGATAAGSDSVNDFDFKDTTAAQTNTNLDADTAGSDNAYNTVWTYPTSNGNGLFQYPDTSNYFQQHQQTAAAAPAFGQSSPFFANSALANDYTNVKPTAAAVTRFTPKPKESSPSKYYSGSFYTKDKTEDFKQFHNIPTSSHLLANYDPFYSPLLSRIDSVFKQLGYTVEPCRERLVCNMYKNPAKYAPFSNLVSAQLSRELNELRKPSSDNPEILRFFKYMKAAKDGQDGQECDIVYSECTTNRAATENAPMVSTYNEINKLVQARNL